jgi:hypothetical protein
LKYEDVFLKGYAVERKARTAITSWNHLLQRLEAHQALGGRTRRLGFKCSFMTKSRDEQRLHERSLG